MEKELNIIPPQGYEIDKTKDGDTYLCNFCADEALGMFVWADDGSPCGIKI